MDDYFFHDGIKRCAVTGGEGCFYFELSIMHDALVMLCSICIGGSMISYEKDESLFEEARYHHSFS